MRGAIFFLVSSLAAVAAADPLGTRASPASFDATSGGMGPVGIGPVVQLVFALALVGVGIKFALPAIVKRFGGRLSTEIGGTIRIEESAAFPGGRLYVVEARGRTLLLGTTAQSVSCLADLTVADFEEALVGAEGGGRRSESAFDQLARLERLAK